MALDNPLIFAPLFNVITFLLLLLSSSTHSQTPLYTWCSFTNSDNYTANSTFETNLNTLLTNLSTTAPSFSGFLTSTSGSAPNRAYGLALCRGDSNSSACRHCLDNASTNFTQLCPYSKDSIMWYDDCLLRYSNQRLTGSVDDKDRVFLWNTRNMSSGNALKFNDSVLDVLNALRTYAVKNATSPGLFAVGSMAIGGLEGYDGVYGLVQCTRDLAPGDCDQCLQTIFTDLPRCCSNKIGGRVLAASCNFRYEVYSFYNSSKELNITPVNAGSGPAVAPALPPKLPPTPPVVSPPPESNGTINGSGSVDSGNRKNRTGTVLAIAIPVGIALLLFVLTSCICLWKKKKKNTEATFGSLQDVITLESLQVDLASLKRATNDFSISNKLGEGGFGSVYKGVLPNGLEIAVKRLSMETHRGLQQLKNEVVLLAKLQHRNLVRILGVCFEGDEKLLIYEYVVNKSMDTILFDAARKQQLSWEARYKVILGIARGLQYLHEESQIKIIHRDLKASNILLDAELNPKISDFGTAKLFNGNQTQASTNTIVGTFGYMPPEYVMRGQFSDKTDVYSFGVLVLEIVTGRKCGDFENNDLEDSRDLLSFVWNHWSNGSTSDIVDPSLRGNYQQNEVIRCIQVGLLCVQELPNERPAMSSIVLMLNSYSVSIHLPKEPVFLEGFSNIALAKEETRSSEQSIAKHGTITPNEVSITELEPR